MATLERAIQIAAQAHEGQKDKQGAPYILHPLRLMMAVEGLEAKMVAVLHDVVEDTSVTLDDLRAAGFSQPVLDGVACVTHRKTEPYADYVVRCKANPLVRPVKLADLRDNNTFPRILLRPDRMERDLSRIRRYVLSYQFLAGQISEPEYRRLMTGDTA
jgi:hypothetical protein